MAYVDLLVVAPNGFEPSVSVNGYDYAGTIPDGFLYASSWLELLDCSRVVSEGLDSLEDYSGFVLSATLEK